MLVTELPACKLLRAPFRPCPSPAFVLLETVNLCAIQCLLVSHWPLAVRLRTHARQRTMARGQLSPSHRKTLQARKTSPGKSNMFLKQSRWYSAWGGNDGMLDARSLATPNSATSKLCSKCCGSVSSCQGCAP